ncbi:MAG: serine hydroxymethyltransferase [Parcubacteria group bacterium]|jgi:glycine hydroxymethyltransferase|nr:serine hydroxymethyltransferase [Parcubacteria group bacterium]|tara:strand:+ start:1994 stop:3235 length:1242 start_codon:yes stop_codon:yes gene_type:complete
MPKDSLSKIDSKINNLIKQEFTRHQEGFNLIASDNYVSLAVREAVGSILSARYAEGYPEKRYYSGQYFIDQIEKTAIQRAKKIFKANYANVQPHSGSNANQAAYFALLKPGDKILSMRIDQGGHLSHGALVNFSGQLYNFVFYGVDKKTERIDYEEVSRIAQKEKPRLIIAGASSYPRQIDFSKFSKIAKENKAYLMADIAHVAGLVAAKLHPQPFPYCDLVTMTTHKTLRGARGGLILSNDKIIAEKIDKAVFPGLQGGPLQNEIAGKAVALKQASQPSFIQYQKQVIKNAQVLAKILIEQGFDLVSGGTDNHLILVNLTKLDLTGKKAQEALEAVNIYVNRNIVPNDSRSKWQTSGIRLGAPAVTSKGLKQKEIKQIGLLIVKILNNIDDLKIRQQVKNQVIKLAKKFPVL